MKHSIYYISFAISCAIFVHSTQAQSLHLTESEVAGVKAKLDAYAQGTLSLESLTDNQESSLQLIAYYLTHSNSVTAMMKLPISKSFFVWSKYPEAAVLAQEYVDVNSNDWHGWRVLGGAKLMMESYDEALTALTNAARLGDKENYASIGGAALQTDRLDVFQKVALPHLLVSMKDPKVPENERIEMRQVLIAYALKADKADIFLKSIEKLNTTDLARYAGLRNLVRIGCDRFESPEVEKLCKALTVSTNTESRLGSTLEGRSGP
jgi:tetratricopeptide (TPR) repeat protein